MKKLILGATLLLTLGAVQQAKSQVGINVNINIGSQPNWGPVGYDYVEYYYLPDIEAYYYVPKHQFVHLNPAGKWVFSNGLPHAYRNYDLYTGYKVVLNMPTPYLYFNTHRIQYVGYRGYRGNQLIIKNSNDPKYKMHKVKVKSTGNARIKPKAVKAKSTGSGKVKSSGKGRGKGNH